MSELNIPGDELEQSRIQLEHNLQHTDLSLHLSSVPDDYHQGSVGGDDADNNNDSIEYPRHNSGPSPFSGFASFEHPSRDHFDGDSHSHLLGWSYRTGDDDYDEGITPFGGETMSTAAHHASALTLSAGLRGPRRDASLSGAEYDPNRPLQDMIAGVDSKFSMFDNDPSKSKHKVSSFSLFVLSMACHPSTNPRLPIPFILFLYFARS